jgi:hypothetical protein
LNFKAKTPDPPKQPSPSPELPSADASLDHDEETSDQRENSYLIEISFTKFKKI